MVSCILFILRILLYQNRNIGYAFFQSLCSICLLQIIYLTKVCRSLNTIHDDNQMKEQYMYFISCTKSILSLERILFPLYITLVCSQLHVLPPVAGVYAYVTLKEGVQESNENIIKELKALVKEQIGSFAVPEMVQVKIFFNYFFLIPEDLLKQHVILTFDTFMTVQWPRQKTNLLSNLGY